MKQLILALLALCAAACTTSPVEVAIWSDGAVHCGYDLNNLCVSAGGMGAAVVRSSDNPAVVMYAVTWDEAVVLVRRNDPEFEARFKHGEPLPAEAAAVVRAVLTQDEIERAGIIFVSE